MADRGVSDVIGFTLIFGLVMATVAVVSLGGMDTLESIRDDEQMTNAVRAYDILADNVRDIHEEGAPSRATEIRVSDALLYYGDPISINVSGVNTADTDENFTLEYQMHPIVYEQTNTDKLVFANGAVLRDNRQGGVVQEEPPFSLGSNRTLIPILQTKGGAVQSVADSTVRIRAVQTTRAVLVAKSHNPYDEVWLNVTTPRQREWLLALDEQPDTSCQVVTQTGTDVVACEIDEPDRLYVSLVKMEVDLEA
jgi:hypothetical protein